MMKKILVTAFISFTTGAICASYLLHLQNKLFTSPEIPDQVSQEEGKEAPQKRSIHLENSVVSVNETDAEEIYITDKKIYLKNLVNEIVRGEFEPGSVTKGRKQQLLKLSNRLGLTPDQLLAAELIWERSGKRSRLWGLRELGILNDEEYEVQIQLLGSINFEEEFKGILTEEQVVIYEEKKSNDRSELSSSLASIEIRNYHLNDPNLYSTEESNIIRKTLIEGFDQNTKFDIPESIAFLDIEPKEKRILTILYNKTSPELFEKAYASIVEGKD